MQHIFRWLSHLLESETANSNPDVPPSPQADSARFTRDVVLAVIRAGVRPGNRLATAIRSGKYKLILRYDDDSVELFDLQKDLDEKNNLAEAKPEVAQRMKLRLDNWLERTRAGLPEKKEVR